MRRVAPLLAVFLLFVPRVSSAIELHWASGADTLTFAEAVRCTLVVQADPEEVRLPAEWRLLWVTDSTAILPVVSGAVSACSDTVAQASDLTPPETPADSAANRTTAHFCSVGEGARTTALYVLDLPAALRASFWAVAIDVTDPGAPPLARSQKVTANGGPPDAESPLVYRANRSHADDVYRVEVAGAGLDAVRAAVLVAANRAWTFPLTISERSSSLLKASASFSAGIESCNLELSTYSGSSTSVALPADTTAMLTTTFTPGSSAMTPGGTIRPKDFAFFFDNATAKFHLFYIRHDEAAPADTATEKDFGHAAMTLAGDFVQPAWTNLDPVLPRRPGMFDALHVWAPSIVKNGPYFYLFYTGVDAIGHQRIGVAWNTDLDNADGWQRFSIPIFGNYAVGWAVRDSLVFPVESQQFRDPFVTADPESIGHWLMYYVTPPVYSPHSYVVGVAKSRGTSLTRWADYGPLHATDSSVTYDGLKESPHIFWSHGKWRLMYTSNSGSNSLDYLEHDVAHSAGDTLRGATDTLGVGWDHWHLRERLNYYDPGDSATVSAWAGSEYLKVADRNEYLAGYYGMSIKIVQFFNWTESRPNFRLGYPSTAAVGGEGPAGDGGELRLRLAECRPGGPRVVLRLEMPRRARVCLTLHDVAGRRVRTLLDEEVEAGERFLPWDGRGAGGGVLASGIYFARASAAPDVATVRVPWIR